MSTAPTDALARRVESCASIADFLALWLERPWLPPAQQEVLEAYYFSYRRRFPPRVRRHYAEQTRELMQLIARHPGARVLEIGAGCGTESLWMALHGAQVLGIDIRDDRLEVARARRDLVAASLDLDLACEFSRRSILALDIDPVDILWLENTFHHLEPRAEVVAKLAQLLRPGGHLVVAEVNALNPALQLSFLRQRGLNTVAVHVDADGTPHPYGVERITTARSLRRALAAEGIRPVSTRHFRMFPNHPAFDPRAPHERQACAWPLRPLATSYTYVGVREAAAR